MPSTQPSVVPTTCPSNVPTSVPTSVPTTTPLTSYPTYKGQSHTPTAIPTSIPTYDPKKYLSDPLYGTYVSEKSSIDPASNIFFSFYRYKSYFIEGTCDTWTGFLLNNLKLPMDNIEISSMTAYFGYNGNRFSTESYTCDDLSSVQMLIYSLQNRTSISLTCNNHIWKVIMCNPENLIFCVDCLGACRTCPGDGIAAQSNFISPCQEKRCDDSLSSSFGIFSLSLREKILYPRFMEPFLVTSTTNTISISVNCSVPGLLTCTIYQGNVSSVTAFMIRERGQTLIVSNASYLSDFLFKDLPGSTLYSVFCLTSDTQGRVMDLTTILKFKTNIFTACCRSFKFLSGLVNVVQAQSSAVVSQSLYFAIDALPGNGGSLRVRLNVNRCPSTVITATIPQPLPLTTSIDSTSIGLVKSFVLQGAISDGCFLVSAQLFSVGSTYIARNTLTVQVYPSSLLPAPLLQSIQFSIDGLFLIATISSKTNCAGSCTNGPSSCFSLFGIQSASCLWSTPTKILIYPLNGYLFYPGDNITLVAGKYKTSCASSDPAVCDQWPSNLETSATLTVPSDAISPVVIISSPRSISPCDDFVIDPTNTYGNGNRPWIYVEWQVITDGEAIDTIATQYFNENYGDTSRIVIVPKQFLRANTMYTFSLSVTNFMRKTAISSISVSVGTRGTPTVNIFGPQVVTIFRPNKLDLTGSLQIPSCATNSSSVIYSWKVFDRFNYDPNLKSISSNPSTFVLPAFTLNTGSTYTVVLTGSYLDSGLYESASTRVTLNVGESGVIAQISGGSERVVQFPFTIDASSSYDIDYPDNGDLSFSWQCNQVLGSSFGTPCGLNSTLFKRPSFVVSNILVAGFSYNFSVMVSKKGTLSKSFAFTVITIAVGAVPNVMLSSTTQLYAADAKVTFSGLVKGAAPTHIYLSCDKVDDLSLVAMSLTPLRLNSTLDLTSVMFALKPYSLFPGSGTNMCFYLRYFKFITWCIIMLIFLFFVSLYVYTQCNVHRRIL